MNIDDSVSNIMTREVISVHPETPVSEVARLLWEHKISSTPVVRGEEVVGIITEYDLIARNSDYDAPRYVAFFDAFFRVPGSGDEEQLRRILATTAGELMTAPVTVIGPDLTIQDVTTAMVEQNLNALPVVDEENRLLGIVSRADIVRLMVFEEERHTAGGQE